MRNSRTVTRQLQIPKKLHGNQHPETNEPANTPTESTRKTKTRQQNPTSQQADEYCQATRPATMKPATAKGASGKGEALRSFMFSKHICYMLPNVHCMILINTYPISKLFKNWLNWSSSLFGARLFRIWQNVEFDILRFIKQNIRLQKKRVLRFLVFFGVLVAWLWDSGTRSKVPTS